MVVDTRKSTTDAGQSQRSACVERRIASYEQPSRVVIDAIADARECDPVEITPPLHDVIDLDALDSLFGPQYDDTSRQSGRVVFAHDECEVVVEGDRVEVFT